MPKMFYEMDPWSQFKQKKIWGKNLAEKSRLQTFSGKILASKSICFIKGVVMKNYNGGGLN